MRTMRVIVSLLLCLGFTSPVLRATRFFKMGICWEGEAPAEPFCKSYLTLGLRLGRSLALPLSGSAGASPSP